MKSPESLTVKYIGYSVPATEDEVELEILGLELAIKCAEQRVALLKQGLKISNMKSKDNKSKTESE